MFKMYRIGLGAPLAIVAPLNPGLDQPNTLNESPQPIPTQAFAGVGAETTAAASC